MKTSEALFKQHGKKFIDAAVIITEYWGYRCDELADITKLSEKNKLDGLKPFRVGRKYMVDIDQLAEVLDSKARG